MMHEKYVNLFTCYTLRSLFPCRYIIMLLIDFYKQKEKRYNRTKLMMQNNIEKNM